jgi:hypothetical protein
MAVMLGKPVCRNIASNSAAESAAASFHKTFPLGLSSFG